MYILSYHLLNVLYPLSYLIFPTTLYSEYYYYLHLKGEVQRGEVIYFRSQNQQNSERGIHLWFVWQEKKVLFFLTTVPPRYFGFLMRWSIIIFGVAIKNNVLTTLIHDDGEILENSDK